MLDPMARALRPTVGLCFGPWKAAKGSYRFIKESVNEFIEDDCSTLAAALAFYTMFSLAPMLIIVIRVVGLVADPAQARETVSSVVEDYMGPQAAEQVQVMVDNAFQPGQGTLATVLGSAAILVGATGVLTMLQSALNTAWEVEPQTSGIKGLLIKRLLSLVMIVGIAALLFLMLVMSTVLTTFGEMISAYLPKGASGPLLVGLNHALSFVVLTLLFAAIYALLPDMDIRWRNVWVGAAATAVLFVLGNFVLGLYFAYGSVGSVYGAAGSLAVILVWVYYSSMIILLGAEFTHVWTRHSREGAG